MKNAFVIALATIAGACSEEQGAVPDAATQIAPRDSVHVEPADLMTSIRGTPIDLVITSSRGEPDENLLAEFNSQRVEVRSSSGRKLALQLEVLPPSRSALAERRVQLRIADTLASEWHEIRLSLAELDVDASTVLLPVTTNLYRSRFHPDSSPVLQRVRACQLTEGASTTMAIRLDFSEPLAFRPEASTIDSPPIRVLVEQVQCPMLATADPFDPEAYTRTYEFRCTVSPNSESLTLDLVREIQASSGIEVSLSAHFPQQTLALSFSDAYSNGGCSQWHLP